MPATPRRRTQEERSARTRELLLDVTIRLLYERGYSATTTMLVAETAEVSRGAMLHQFRTKADLMTFVVQAVYERERKEYREWMSRVKGARERAISYPGQVWRLLSRPSGVAVLEILQGSRSDAVLAAQLVPVQDAIERDALAGVSHYLGSEDRRTITALMQLVVWSARGLSIANVLASDSGEIQDAIEMLGKLLNAGIETGLIKLPERE